MPEPQSRGEDARGTPGGSPASWPAWPGSRPATSPPWCWASGARRSSPSPRWSSSTLRARWPSAPSRRWGTRTSRVLVAVILIVLGVLFAWSAGWPATAWWQALLLLAVIGGHRRVRRLAAAQRRRPRSTCPILVGFVTWLICLSILADNLRAAERRERPTEARPAGRPAPQRRGFLLGAGVMLAASVGVGVLGRVLGAGRRKVEDARALLRLPGVTEPVPPDGVSVGLKGIAPWETRRRRLLPDRHRDRAARHRADVLAAADPRDGRQGAARSPTTT